MIGAAAAPGALAEAPAGPPGPPEGQARPAFQIVPLRGVPVVVVALGLLIAAIIGNWLWALDFFHIVGGALWTGIDLFVGLIIGPIIGRLSIPARMEFSVRFMPKMVLLMPTLVTLTLASGWQLARRFGYLTMPYPQHWWITASFIVVGVMTLIAIGLLEPANLAVLFELKKPHPNGELVAKLMRRFIYASGITGTMQLAILVIMTRITTW
ncbi:MAG: hypothetical protein ACRDGF_03695 [Chloroflexota bacterium]